MRLEYGKEKFNTHCLIIEYLLPADHYHAGSISMQITNQTNLDSTERSCDHSMIKIGNRTFDTNHDCYIMGILNVTPDSFSDGGQWNDMERAKAHVSDMIAAPVITISVHTVTLFSASGSTLFFRRVCSQSNSWSRIVSSAVTTGII